MQMPPTDAEAWKRFEVESSSPQRSPLPAERQFEIAKYDFDTGVFAINRFAENLNNNADFSIEQNSLGFSEVNSSGEPRNNPHTKFDLCLGEEGRKPQLVMRFIIPFGN